MTEGQKALMDKHMVRPVHSGQLGAVSAAHPLAVAAGQEMLLQGGNAADALIAAQAVLCVIMPASCGLGGDLLALVHQADGAVTAVNGIGKSASDPRLTHIEANGTAVTVPGMVRAWAEINRRFGSCSLRACLAFARRLAEGESPMSASTAGAVRKHHARLEQGGAGGWCVLDNPERCQQSALASLLAEISELGPAAFYEGAMAAAIEAAVARHQGFLSAADLAAHETSVLEPLSIEWQGGRVFVQPPMTQGVLLALCLENLKRFDLSQVGRGPLAALDHLAIELTGASFEHRHKVAEGARLLDLTFDVNPDAARQYNGPRAYLHTAGVATADRQGMVISSLVSVFDEFGSCIFVPEGGFTLNNRGQGFTEAPNDAAPGKYPVHTLAPMMWVRPGDALAMATPGADGQIQTLLQILLKLALPQKSGLAGAIAAPRWRSEDGRLLLETSHASRDELALKGHAIQIREDGASPFGGVVATGFGAAGPYATSDWRREVWHGVV